MTGKLFFLILISIHFSLFSQVMDLKDSTLVDNPKIRGDNILVDSIAKRVWYDKYSNLCPLTNRCISITFNYFYPKKNGVYSNEIELIVTNQSEFKDSLINEFAQILMYDPYIKTELYKYQNYLKEGFQNHTHAAAIKFRIKFFLD